MSDFELVLGDGDNIELVIEGPVTIVSGATSTFNYVQSIPATIWTINHNLNRKVSGQAFNLLGQLVGVDGERVSDNIFRFTFLQPTSGEALIF
jgi:hypothetical protein